MILSEQAKTIVLRRASRRQEYEDRLAESASKQGNTGGNSMTLGLMAMDHMLLATIAYFSDRSVVGLKQHFYIASRLMERSYAVFEGDSFGQLDVLFSLLSDNEVVIEAMASMATQEHLKRRDLPTLANFYGHMYQLAVLKDSQALQAKLDVARDKAPSELRKEFDERRDFFTLLLAQDAAGLAARSAWLTRKREADHPVIDKLFSSRAMLEAKIAWRWGIKLDLDPDRFPVELVPCTPLEQYDDVYDFLAPGWEPRPRGLLDKLLPWRKR